MRRVFSLLTMLTWALWLGGLVTIVISVIAIAQAHPPKQDPTIFVGSAPHIFHAFERYQLGLSVAATLFTLISFAITRARVHLIVLGLFWAATVAALTSTLYTTPAIDRLRAANQMDTAEFDQAHQRSTWLYSAEVIALLLAGLIIPMTFEPRYSERTVQEVSQVPGLRV